MSSRASRPVVLAPGALSSVGAYAPGRGGRVRDLPAVDARLVVPESHTEMVDGVVYQTMGANPPHATQHAQVARSRSVLRRPDPCAGLRAARARLSVRTVLMARGLALSDTQHVRIEGCDDLDTLTRWLQRAVIATTTDDMFG